MHIQGAVIREQGQAFAVVIVKPHVVRSIPEATKTIAGLVPVFGVPVVLVAQDNLGRPTYYGRPDITRFLASVPMHRMPWRRYTLN